MNSTDRYWRMWWSSGATKESFFYSEKDLRIAAKKYNFDADTVLNYGEAYLWDDGVTPNSDPSADEIWGGVIEEHDD